MSKIEGLDSLLEKLDSLGGNAEKTVHQAVNKMGLFVQGEAKDLCPVDTGDLRQSIQLNVVQAEGRVSSVISTNSDHAAYIEFGTGSKGENTPIKDKYPGELSYHKGPWFIHEDMMNGLSIKPEHVENIPFIIGKDGKKMYIMNGQPAQPFLYPALKNNREKILNGIKDEVQKSIKEISGQ
jgi:HK97 gp10 family phage protein